MTSHPNPLPAMPREIEKLRAMLDARLTALEMALADPRQHSSLEQNILDLARVATEEADATARQADLDAEREGQRAIAAARAEARAALAGGPAVTASLRLVLREAHAAIQKERAARATLDRDLAGARQALVWEHEEEQKSVGSLRRELEEAAAAMETGQAAAAALKQELDQALASLQSERAARSARELDLVATGQALQQALEQEQKSLASLRREPGVAGAAGGRGA